MSEPKTIEEVPNWVIVNALRCPIESQISIVAKLLQHLDREQRNQALSMSGVSKSACKHPREFHQGGEEVTFCGLCGEMVY